MATRSNINVKVGDKYHCIYCHFDGYVDGVGKTLYENYSSQELAEQLVSNGNLSSLGQNCTKPDGHSYNNQIKGYSVYYGRDRGEEDQEMEILNSPLFDQEYSYVWNGTAWIVSGAEYDEDDNLQEYVDVPVACMLGIEPFESGNDTDEDESSKVFKYFGTNMDEVQEIYNEWDVTFNTPDEKMTDAWNDRVRWMIRHRFAPYQGIDSDGIWHHTFFGRTLFEAVTRAKEYIARGKAMEESMRGRSE